MSDHPKSDCARQAAASVEPCRYCLEVGRHSMMCPKAEQRQGRIFHETRNNCAECGPHTDTKVPGTLPLYDHRTFLHNGVTLVYPRATVLGINRMRANASTVFDDLTFSPGDTGGLLVNRIGFESRVATAGERLEAGELVTHSKPGVVIRAVTTTPTLEEFRQLPWSPFGKSGEKELLKGAEERITEAAKARKVYDWLRQYNPAMVDQILREAK